MADQRTGAQRPARRRGTYHHGDLKRALTQAALVLVAEKGPKGFTLTEAARRAGVSAAAPYRHFADKAQLLAAVAEEGFIQLHEALTAASDGASDPENRVIDLGRAYVHWAVNHPDYYLSMFGAETIKRDHPGLLIAGGRAFGELVDAITSCLESGVMEGQDPIKIAGPLWSLVHGVASLAIGGDLCQVGIAEDPEAIVVRAMTESWTVAKPG
ncbi:MAG: TetR/AcrR family transcriptional regulator [Mycobacterium sp.]